MAFIQIKLEDKDVIRIYDAFAKSYGWPETLEDGMPNPQTKEEFAKMKIAGFIKDVTMGQEVQDAVDIAREEVLKGVIIITAESISTVFEERG